MTHKTIQRVFPGYIYLIHDRALLQMCLVPNTSGTCCNKCQDQGEHRWCVGGAVPHDCESNKFGSRQSNYELIQEVCLPQDIC